MTHGPHQESFGQRLRRVRRAANLSQTDLASDTVSASYVSLLKWTSASQLRCRQRARPKLGCPRHAAQRGRPEASTGSTWSSSTPRWHCAMVRARARSPGWTSSSLTSRSARAASRARRLRAEALESTGELDRAVRELDALHVQAVATHDWTESLRLTIPLARCYKELGDIRHALTLIGDGLDSAKQDELLGGDPHAELAAMAVGLHYLLGDLAHAELLAEEALTHLEGQAGPGRARGSVYWNASLDAQARGNTRERRWPWPTALQPCSPRTTTLLHGAARLRNAYAWLLLRTSPDRIDKARELPGEVPRGPSGIRHRRRPRLLRNPDSGAHGCSSATRSRRCDTPRPARRDVAVSKPQHQIAHAELVIA